MIKMDFDSVPIRKTCQRKYQFSLLGAKVRGNESSSYHGPKSQKALPIILRVQ